MSKWLLQRKDFEILLKVTDFENLTLKKCCCSIFLFFCKWNFLKNMADFFAKMSAVYRTYKITKKLSFQNTCPCQKFCQKNFSAKKIQNYFCLTEICKMYYPFIFLIYLHIFYQIIWIRLLMLGLPEILQKHNHLACLTEIKKILIRFFASFNMQLVHIMLFLA